MSIKDGLNWLKKQAASPSIFDVASIGDPMRGVSLPRVDDANYTGGVYSPPPQSVEHVPSEEEQRLIDLRNNGPQPTPALQPYEVGIGDVLGGGGSAGDQGLFMNALENGGPATLPPGYEPTSAAQGGEEASQPEPQQEGGATQRGGAPLIDPAVDPRGFASDGAGLAIPVDAGPAPTLPTTAATMADGPEMPSISTTAQEQQNSPAPTPTTPAPTTAPTPSAPTTAPTPSVPTTAATMAGGAEPIQADSLNVGNGLTSSTSGVNLTEPTQGTTTPQQPQATPNGSSDYSRIFGRGFRADSGSASDKWLAGQADKLRTAGYSDNQISTMLGPDAWRKYGRNGQDYQVNTKRYTKPLGVKSASVADDLWSKQAGLNDDLDDLYVRRLRVGLWDKYNG